MKALAWQFAKTSCILLSLAFFGLSFFSLYWACAYRLPRSQPLLVDLRSDKTGEAASNRCFMICAGLANNPHGYPGHCYIIWDRCRPERLDSVHSDGFVPARMVDLLPSVYSDVAGAMGDRALFGNMRSFDYIAVKLDSAAYDRARKVRASFEKDPTFHTGVRDCVAYVNQIAIVSGLRTPPPSFLYPLDYLICLKNLNRPLQRK